MCLVELLRLMHSPTGSLDIDDDGVMHKPIDDRHGRHRVAQILAQGLKIHIGSQNGAFTAITPINDLEKKCRRFRGSLLESVETQFIDTQQIRSEIRFST